MLRLAKSLRAAFCLPLLTLGCTGSLQSTAAMTPKVPIEEAPSKGLAFDFCADPPADQPLSLTNAAWLSFFSANEYAHAKVFAPQLNQLGFYNPAFPRDRDWANCTGDIRELRTAQIGREEELSRSLITPALKDLALSLLPSPESHSWGECARSYLEGAAFDRAVFPAAGFQRDLVQHVYPGSYLQFFTGGTIDSKGKAFRDLSTQVVFAENKDKRVAIIAFRGTEPSQLQDIAVDLKMWKTPLEKHHWPPEWGRVHSGFFEAFEQVEPLLMMKLKELENTDTPIWVTGHSLGGALATLMAARILRAEDEGMHLRFRGVYTFGSPRVGDLDFAKTYQEELSKHSVSSVRVRNSNDLVTSVPGANFDYRHVGTLTCIGEGKLQVEADGEAPYGGALTFGDHNISGFGGQSEATSGYYRRLHELLSSGHYPELTRCDPGAVVQASPVAAPP